MTDPNLPTSDGNLPDTTPPVAPDVRGVRRGMFGASLSGDTSGFGGLTRPVVFPQAAVRPYGEYYDEIVDTLEAAGGQVDHVVVDRGELTLHVDREALKTVMSVMRDDPALRFEACMSVSGVHYPDDRGRELHAVYHLKSYTHAPRRVRIEVSCPDADPRIPSVVDIYPMVDWHERETFDMFGIVFTGRESLTRILMPDDWDGHPQRKDYPLGGIHVQYKGASTPPPDQRRSYN